ncbi:uncharacterized protein LOC133392765 [Anopheles gambiae]|uniref:uncharacterized protein LOC133392765 n=1 Tax=Anopheles gambiae TaxID=7165 RepID=UPI001AADD577|nr:uncharacterized protein LOC133392765 [Anopheles gambiae]
MPPTAEPPTVAKKEASAALPNKNKAKQKVSLNIIYPPFEPELLDFWFLALEATFVMNGHYSDRYRYNALITCLGSRAKMVRKTIQMCSTLNSKKKYKILKAAVRACYPTVEEQKPATTPHPLTTVKLGDRKPSELLAEMRLLGKGCPDSLLEYVWLRALPASIQSAVSVHVDAVEVPSIDDSAAKADKMLEKLRRAEERAKQNKITNQQMSQVTALMDKIMKTTEELRLLSASSSKAQDSSSTVSWTCWYHSIYGRQAYNCEVRNKNDSSIKCDFLARNP